MRHLLNLAICATIFLLLPGCATDPSPGPQGACDECSIAEAKAGCGVPFAPGAAAAAASKGPSASNAPYNRDTARIAPVTVLDRGPGDNLVVNSPEETRETASGGAMNVSVTTPTTSQANASAGGGKSDPLVDTLFGYAAEIRDDLSQTLEDPTADPQRIAYLTDRLDTTIAMISEARLVSRASHVTNNYFERSRNMVVGMSTSKTGSQPGIDPANTAAISAAVAAASNPVFEESESDVLAEVRTELNKRKAEAKAAIARAKALEAPETGSSPATGSPDDTALDMPPALPEIGGVR